MCSFSQLSHVARPSVTGHQQSPPFFFFKEQLMRASTCLVFGRFFGGELEPGTFHQEVATGTAASVKRRHRNVADDSPALPQMGSAAGEGTVDPTVPKPEPEATATRV
jgi:hypothetical protein